MEYSINGFDRAATVPSDGGMVKFGSDSNMNVIFYMRNVLDMEASKTRGIRIEKSVPYVRIQQPGERDTVDRPLKGDMDDAIRRFPAQYQAFLTGRKPIPAGTPVDILFPQNAEIPANLHTMGVHTIQQLANLTSHGIDTIGMGAGMWKQKAVDFLKAAEGTAGYHRLDSENEKLKGQLEVQANQIAMLRSQLDTLIAREKGVPPAMIRPFEPNIAQASLPQSEDDAAENEFDETPASGGDPLFEEPAESYGDAPAPVAAMKRRGRPPKIRE